MSDAKTVGAQLDAKFDELAKKSDVAEVRDRIDRVESTTVETQRLMLGRIDAVHANTQTIEKAFRDQGASLKLTKAKKTG